MKHSIGSTISATANGGSEMRLMQDFVEQLWRAIDDSIDVGFAPLHTDESHCKIYSYLPDGDEDPFADDGCMYVS